jgi:tRNA G46 methylase TrmB
MSLLPKPPLDPDPLSPYVAWAGNRNRDPILDVFKQKFPQEGNVLELATGNGMHIHYFAPHFQNLNFQPSDFDQKVFKNIQNLTQQTNAKNVEPPINLDLLQPSTWLALDNKKFDVIFCINIIHVAPIFIS